MPVTAVVPVKELGSAKSRLAKVLSPRARRSLVLDMLELLLSSVARSHVRATLVVTRDPDVVAAAKRFGAEVMVDRANELNVTLLAGFARCWEREQVPLYLPADLPNVDATAIDELLDEGRGEDCVVLAPAHDGGTNALMAPPAAPLPPRLGASSFERHLEEARRRGYETHVVESQALELDVDTPAELERVRLFARAHP